MVGVSLFLIAGIINSSPIIISEVLANVKGSDSGLPGQRNEFVEIYNNSSDTIDVCGYHIFDFDPANPDTICPWNDSTILIKYPQVRINSTKFYPQTYSLILDRDYTRPDTGQYLQPYQFPEGILIITTDDHTICNELTTKDPLIFYSKDLACTTSFGTPYNSADSIPFDPGDGISLERIVLNEPDSVSNWWPSLDSSGSTPGRENSTSKSYDLEVETNSISFRPAIVEIGEDVEIEVSIANRGLRRCQDWKLHIFDDMNKNQQEDGGEMINELTGCEITPQQVSIMKSTYPKPAQGDHQIGFKIIFLPDIDTLNNIAFKALLVTGKVGAVGVSPLLFSPDGDGNDDIVQIDYRLPQVNGRLTISIYDVNGMKVKNLVSNQKAIVDHGTITWNGTNRYNRIAPIGIYIVYMEYSLTNGSVKAKKTVVLAKKKP